MLSIILSWLILSLAVYLTAALLPGFEVTGFRGALWVALWLGVVEWVIGWLLFGLIGIVTLGIGFLLAFLTRWLVAAILLKFVDSFSTNLRIRSFGTAFLGAMLMSGVGTLGEWMLRSAR